MRFKKKWQKVWNFEKKMCFVIEGAILLLMAVALGTSAAFFVHTVSRQNDEYASAHLDSMAKNYGENLDQYKALAVSLVLDEKVQRYCGAKDPREATLSTGDAYAALKNIQNIQKNVNFIAVTSDTLGSYVYSGNISAQSSNFESGIRQDYGNSVPANKSGSLRASFSDCFSRKGEYTLTVYFSVYSLTHMVSSNGTVVINLTDRILEDIREKTSIASASMYLILEDGTIVSTDQWERMGERLPYADRLFGGDGSFWYEGKKVNFRRVGNWNYYLIHELSVMELYGNVIQIAVVMCVVMLAVTGFVLAAARKMVGRLYRPINKIISKMNDVTEGDLSTRIHTIDTDSDSQKLAVGFNRMMDEIDLLMDQVKEEEQQMTQVQLNALQSQIQPHFLYNTLECIHWQAVTDGSRKISAMVKALAQYYRICLSGGQDVISLETELSHVRNYLIIQNMRYDNIIELRLCVEEAYLSAKIPKLTLQPLVENSIYHGIRVKEGRKGVIEITARESGEDLVLLVEDDGQGMSLEEIRVMNENIREFDRTMGYGTNNVNKRLELLFGEQYGLRFAPRKGGGLSVEIRLPGPGNEKKSSLSGTEAAGKME